MPSCTSCGSSIPEGQGKSCSMCYGDPDHGRDGYYRAELEREEQRRDYERWEREQEQERDADRLRSYERKTG